MDNYIKKISRIINFLIPRGAILPILAGPLRGLKWIPKSANLVCFLGKYEDVKVKRFVSEIRDKMVIYDIGAHVGYYTLISSKNDPNGLIVAFEPFPKNIANLWRHIELNNIKNVKVVGAAVSDFSGKTRFTEYNESDYMNKLEIDGQIMVSVVKLDDMVKSNLIPAPDLLKIDAEGAEYAILRGAEEIIHKNKPTLFLATHGKSIHNKCIKFLKDKKYILTPLNSDQLINTSEILAKYSN